MGSACRSLATLIERMIREEREDEVDAMVAEPRTFQESLNRS